MKQIFKKIAIGFLLSLNLFAFTMPATIAANTNPEANGFYNDDTQDVLKSFQDESGFNSFTGNNSPVQGEGSGGIKTLTGLLGTILALVKYIVGGLAVFMLVITIIQLIVASPDESEEKLDTLKKHLGYIITAVIIIISADTIFRVAFDVSGSGFLANETTAKTAALAGAAEIRGLYTLIESIVGVIAVLMIVIAGFKMNANAGNEEVTDKAKKQLIYAGAGLILIAISEFVVKDILFKDAGTKLGLDAAKTLLVKFTNFSAGFISFLAVMSFFYAGYLYIFSGIGEDNTDKVKKILIGAVVGIIISAGAFALVNTVVQLDDTNNIDFVESSLEEVR